MLFRSPRLAFAREQSPAEPERIEATVTDSLSGPSPTAGSIAVRPADSAAQFKPIPTKVSGGRLIASWDSDAYPAGSQQPPQVLGETFFRSPPAAAAAGPGAGAGGVSVGSVAFTGFDVLLFLAIAIVAVTLGLLLRRAGNRPAAR